jgi:STELLO glycosyltransferases
VKNRLFGIITTIQEPTPSTRRLSHCLQETDARLLVIGDQKGPASFDQEGVEFLSLPDQLALDLDLARKLPTGHYTRKNVGYLVAIQRGASCLYETDDDNAPLSDWAPRRETVEALTVEEKRWINVYRCFSEKKIWPRGFPLGEIRDSLSRDLVVSEAGATRRAPIQQGLANNSPDVDAVWRLVLDEAFDFQPGPSVYLPRGAWCPFNSQSTWWFPVAYPLMYLPSYCSFRMTDIWRSFIAQRCLWEMGLGLVFHGPEVVQERNAHNLMRDFADEIPGYTRNGEMVEILERLALVQGPNAVAGNLLTCYEALIKAEFFPAKELDLVTTWLDDLRKISAADRITSGTLESNLSHVGAHLE